MTAHHLQSERRQWTAGAIDLKTENGLSLATDIRFDEATGQLRLSELEFDRAARDRVVEVHSSDRTAFARARQCDALFLEFRAAGAAPHNWFLLSARGLIGPARWRSGWMARRPPPESCQHPMLQQARLMELGGMASAIGHELKQPLFTISLSAENGRLLLDQDTPESIADARAKFARIAEQVNRARDIIARVARHARIEDDDARPIELGAVIEAAFACMGPLLLERNIAARIDLPKARIRVLVPRMGMEQIVLNAIRNAIEAIASRREEEGTSMAGEVMVTAASCHGGIRIQIADNGTGVTFEHPGSAFDAFFTTKAAQGAVGLGLHLSRQIMMEIGGGIGLGSRPGTDRGAVLTIDLPAFVVLDERQADGRVARRTLANG